MTHDRVTAYVADRAWVNGRVAADVGLEIDADGLIRAVTPGRGAGQRIAGLVVPGVANLHSHAFERALAGLAERGDRPAAMDRLLGVLTPDDVEAITAEVYAEGLLHGYTAVAEFQLLHNAPDGRPYDDPAEMSLRIVAAARQASIGLSLLPVLVRRGGYGVAAPAASERRSVMPLEAYGRLCQDLCQYAQVGVAPRSLAAVTPDDLAAALVIADLLGPASRVHVGLAEAEREVEECVARSGRRPGEWLLDHAPVDARWCLVHATHLDGAECRALAATGAVLGVCQTSEANVGDGITPLVPWLAAGGRFGIGSGSNVSTSPVEELRWLEYTRRLAERQRNAAPAGLLMRAAAGGAQALGRPAGVIAPGRLADLVVLDPEHPVLVGRHDEAVLDAWVFAGNATPVRHVMVGGQWVVQHGRHVRGGEIAAAFARRMHALAAF